MIDHVFIIDCSKVIAYKPNPEAAARWIAEMLVPGTSLEVYPVHLGKVCKTVLDGPNVRIYVELDDRIEHATFQGGT